MNHILAHISNDKTLFPLFSWSSLVGGLTAQNSVQKPQSTPSLGPRQAEGEQNPRQLACHELKSSALIPGYTLLNFHEKNTVITHFVKKKKKEKKEKRATVSRLCRKKQNRLI
jgi:hypothetical protein